MKVRVLSRAKLNLFLRVRGVRRDGFHEIESVMQTIELCDEITMEPSEVTDVQLAWASGLSGQLPESPDLTHRAIDGFAALEGTAKARAQVVKRIPIGAGLAGGSSNAAAALLGMSAIYETGAKAGLMPLAETLGSDVPFCLIGGTHLVTGRGEVLEEVETQESLWWVLGMSEEPMSTHRVYQAFDRLAEAPGGAAASEMREALSKGTCEDVAGFLRNDLEEAVATLWPEVAGMKRTMREAGAIGALMTGSGSAIAGLCADESSARAVAAKVSRHFARAVVCESSSSGAEVVSVA